MPQARQHPLTSLEVAITSLGGLGDGIGHHNEKTVFIPKSLPGDLIKARIVHENRDGMYGQIAEILSPSKDRQTPPCRYFDRCGGCSLQQLTTTAYQSFKLSVLRNAVSMAGFDNADTNVNFLPANSRRRVEFKIDYQTEIPKLCFFEERSHTPVPINKCIILRPELDALIAPINNFLSITNNLENLYSVALTYAGESIDMMMTFRDTVPEKIAGTEAWSKQHNIARMNVRTREGATRTIIENSTFYIPLYGYNIPLPPNVFLQASTEGQDALTNAVVNACRNSKSVADLFCGIGSYSIPLTQTAKVHAVEGDETMVQSLYNAAQKYKISELSCEKRDLFKSPLTPMELKRFDSVVLNPPRVGAKAQCEALAQSNVNHVVMVSCNPASFTRDSKILKNAGFKLLTAQGVDQFVFSAHLEIVAVFSR